MTGPHVLNPEVACQIQGVVRIRSEVVRMAIRKVVNKERQYSFQPAEQKIAKEMRTT